MAKYEGTFYHNKLVRDNIPQILTSKNVKLECVNLDKMEFINALLCKLLEEAEEVTECTSEKELIEELADLQEAIDCLCRTLGVERSQVAEVQRLKRETEGGFDNKMYLVWTKTPAATDCQG